MKASRMINGREFIFYERFISLDAMIQAKETAQKLRKIHQFVRIIQFCGEFDVCVYYHN